jgi:hypothetical protein
MRDVAHRIHSQESVDRVLGVVAAIFAMESEPLLNRTGTLYFCTLYFYVQKRGRGGGLAPNRRTKRGVGKARVTREKAAS